MSITLETIMAEKADISKFMSSKAHTDDERKELNMKLGKLLKEHGRHLIEYFEGSGTTDAEKTGMIYINWGEYLIRITESDVKFGSYRS
jgi:hypothetical protein